MDIVLFVLLGGLPFYPVLEKQKMQQKHIFYVVATSISLAFGLSLTTSKEGVYALFVLLALVGSVYTLTRAMTTSNLYALAYYTLGFNAPAMLLFGSYERVMYGVSLVVTIGGIFMMARYYERVYGSANYRQITGITLITPYAGLFLTIYFTSLALYPPFPNSILFLNGILHAQTDWIWYLCVAIVFFGNFLIAVRVMARTVFGKPNPHVHYLDVRIEDRWVHFGIIFVLFALSILGLKEILS